MNRSWFEGFHIPNPLAKFFAEVRREIEANRVVDGFHKRDLADLKAKYKILFNDHMRLRSNFLALEAETKAMTQNEIDELKVLHQQRDEYRQAAKTYLFPTDEVSAFHELATRLQKENADLAAGRTEAIEKVKKEYELMTYMEWVNLKLPVSAPLNPAVPDWSGMASLNQQFLINPDNTVTFRFGNWSFDIPLAEALALSNLPPYIKARLVKERSNGETNTTPAEMPAPLET